MTASEGFSKASRLIRPAEFASVYKLRRSAARGPLVMYAAPRDGGDGCARVGLSVSRRIGNAVVRNSWKRRLREAFRRVQAKLPPAHDYIVVVRSGRPQPGAEGARQTEQAIVELAARVVGRERGAR